MSPSGPAEASPDSPWRIDWREEVKSTQDLAIAAAVAGEPGRMAFVAARQIAGKGRDGRVWRAPEGNLNFSALLRPGGIRPVAARWALMAGVAVHDATAYFMPKPAGLMLKWPNDLLLGGAKVAGVLIDSALTAEGMLDWVVIGIGVNLAEAPMLPDRATACLAAAGVSVAPADLAARLMGELDRWAARDLAAIRQAWLARAHPPGTALRVQQGARVIHGVFEGLGDDGGLLMHGLPVTTTGDVSLEGPHAAGR